MSSLTIVNWKKQLILASVLFVLGSAAYWYEFKQLPKEEENEEAVKKPLVLKDQQIKTIELATGTQTFIFECLDIATKLCKPGDNSKWKITSPSQLIADDSNTSSLLTAINSLTATETISLKEETPEKRTDLLKQYKLDAESRKSVSTRHIAVTLANGDRRVLYLGDSHPISEGVFAILDKDDSKVFITPKYFNSNFDHDLTYWRNKKIFQLTSSQILGFELNGTKGELTAQKKDGKWLISTKNTPEVLGDSENIEALLSTVTYAAARKFVAEKSDSSEATHILKDAKRALTLTLHINTSDKVPGTEPAKVEPKPLVLALYEKKIKGIIPEEPDSHDDHNHAAAAKKKPAGPTFAVFATVTGLDPLVEMEASLKTRLDKEFKDLRLMKLVTSMERYSARQLKFEGGLLGTQSIALTNANPESRWQTVDTKKEVDAEKVQTILDKISGNRILEFVAAAKAPSGQDKGLKLTLSDDTGAAQRSLVFWKSGDKFYARDLNSKRDEIFVVDKAIEAVLPSSVSFFEKLATPSPLPVISLAPAVASPEASETATKRAIKAHP